MAALGLATFYDNVWIFNIADVVVQEQTITNDHSELNLFIPIDIQVNRRHDIMSSS